MRSAMRRAAGSEIDRSKRRTWVINAVAQTAPLFCLLVLIEGTMKTPQFSWACQSAFLQPDPTSLWPAGICLLVALGARSAHRLADGLTGSLALDLGVIAKPRH